MKTIAAVLVLCLASALADITDEQKDKLMQYKNECMEGTGITDDIIRDALSGASKEKNKQLQCFAACILKKIGIMHPDGTVNVDVAREQAPPDAPKDEVEEVIAKCKDITGSDECEAAIKLVECFMETKTFNVMS